MCCIPTEQISNSADTVPTCAPLFSHFRLPPAWGRLHRLLSGCRRSVRGARSAATMLRPRGAEGGGGHPVLDPPHFRCTHFGISSFVTDPRQKGWGKPVPIRGSCGRADDSACGSFAGLQQRTSRRVLFERLVAQLHLEVGVCRCRQLSTTLKHFQRLLAACARRCQS